MTITVQFTLQRPPGLRSNMAMLEPLLSYLDEISAMPLMIDLRNPEAVKLTVQFQRKTYNNPLVDEEQAGDLFWKHFHGFSSIDSWSLKEWKVLEFEPDTVPDESEWKANQSIGVRPFGGR